MVVAELAVVVELLLEVIAIVVTSGMVVAELAVVVADAVFVIVVDDKLTEDEANVVEASVVIELLVVECPGIAAVVIECDGVLEVWYVDDVVVVLLIRVDELRAEIEDIAVVVVVLDTVMESMVEVVTFDGNVTVVVTGIGDVVGSDDVVDVFEDTVVEYVAELTADVCGVLVKWLVASDVSIDELVVVVPLPKLKDDVAVVVLVPMMPIVVVVVNVDDDIDVVLAVGGKEHVYIFTCCNQEGNVYTNLLNSQYKC